MPSIDEHGRPEPELAADEVTTLRGFLDYQRATLAWKTGGLDSAGLAATVGASTMTLGGLLKHLAWVESHWFTYRLFAESPGPPWDAVDWDSDPDWEWHSAADDSPQQLHAVWEREVARAQVQIDRALAEGGLDRVAGRSGPNGEAPSLRVILVHMIEEYARHNGHADLLRESVDGEVGE